MARGRLLVQIRRRVRLIRVRRFVLWGCLALATWALVAGQDGFVRFKLLKNKQADLKQENQKLTAQIMDLECEIRRLQHDTLYIEKVARERLGYARPDERVFKITPH